MTVNIKYCGGCNPRYQRGAFAKKLQAQYPMNTYTINGIGEFDLLIVLYGCTAACADISDCIGVFGHYYVTDSEQWGALCEFMDSIKIHF